jgi:hypothetical protein
MRSYDWANERLIGAQLIVQMKFSWKIEPSKGSKAGGFFREIPV